LIKGSPIKQITNLMIDSETTSTGSCNAH